MGNNAKSSFREKETDIFACEFDTILEELKDLLLIEAGIGIGTIKMWLTVEGDGLSPNRGGACRACLGTLEVVVVGAEEEGAGRRLEAGGHGEALLLGGGWVGAEDVGHWKLRN